jgi:molybdenum cofactor biosynthesis enzyme MoaA
MPASVERLVDEGLDSIRVSLNSLRENVYSAYFRPQGYGFDDVLETIRVCRRKGIWVSVNLLCFPGVSDTVDELEALRRLVADVGVDFIQMRNLNIDPEVYVRVLPAGTHGRGVGIRRLMQDLKEEFPHLRFGYFNPPKEAFRASDSA